MNRKSHLCKAKKTGRPLMEYDSKAEAQSAANYANKTYRDTNLLPYKCEQCGLWHLSPANRQTPSQACPVCRGSDGKPKAAYTSKKDAYQRASILRKEQGVTLKVYECEHGNGWHLTKTQVSR